MPGPEGLEFVGDSGEVRGNAGPVPDGQKMKSEELAFPDSIFGADQPVETEEVDDEEAEEEEEVEEEVPQTKKKKPVQAEEDEPAPEKPVSYEQAYNHYRTQYIAQSLKESGFEVKDDLSNLRDMMAQAAKEDPVGWQEVREYANNIAKNNADAYHRDKILPFENYHIRRGIKNFISRLNEHYTDIQEYLPDMQKSQEQFFRKFPELINDPIRAIPLLYLEAKEARLKKATKKSSSRTTMETGGARRISTSNRNKASKEKDIDFKELVKFGTDRFVGGIF